MGSTAAQPGTTAAPSRRFARTRTRALRPLRWLHNLFIAALLFLLLVDGLPCAYKGHERVKNFLNPVVDKLGLWQGNWKLFAPDPDHMNTWIEAKVKFADGSSWSWKTPDWQNRSLFEKFMQGRHPKFWDAFRLDRRKSVFPYVARYAARIAPRPASGAKALQVELIRHWWDVPPPAERAAAVAKYGAAPPPRDRYPNQFSYYTEKLR